MSMQPRVETIPREQPSRSQRIDELVQAAGQDGATEVIARLRSTIAVLCELLVELQQAAIGIESERTGDVTPAGEASARSPNPTWSPHVTFLSSVSSSAQRRTDARSRASSQPFRCGSATDATLGATQT